MGGGGGRRQDAGMDWRIWDIYIYNKNDCSREKVVFFLAAKQNDCSSIFFFSSETKNECSNKKKI